MKVLFIYLTTTTSGEEHLGTASIASYLKQHGIEAELKLIVYDDKNYLINEIINEIPSSDIVGFPIFNTNAQIIFEVAEGLKNKCPETLLSVGGPLATDAADYILRDCQYIDFVTLGDGEQTYLDLVAALENNLDIRRAPHILFRDDKNRNDKSPAIIEIENLPWVSRQYLEQVMKRGFVTARLTAARGCCANCSFCSHNSYTRGTNKIWRGRSVKDVFDEVIYLYEKYGVQSFTFNDGSFEDPGKMGRERIKNFCDLVISSGHHFHFSAFLRANTFSAGDVKFVKHMRAAGFTRVFIGIESQNEADLRFFNKIATKQQNLDAIQLFNSCEISVTPGFIMFNPISSLESLKENYMFFVDMKLWHPKLFISKLDIFYKTAIYYKCKDMNLLNKDYSYLNTHSYRFMDAQVKIIWDFVEENLLNSVVFTEYDSLIFNLYNCLCSLIAIFPDDITIFFQQLNAILSDVSIILTKYFYDLYYVLDLCKAKENIKGLEKDMYVLVRKIQSLKTKLMLNKSVRELMFNMKGGKSIEKELR